MDIVGSLRSAQRLCGCPISLVAIGHMKRQVGSLLIGGSVFLRFGMAKRLMVEAVPRRSLLTRCPPAARWTASIHTPVPLSTYADSSQAQPRGRLQENCQAITAGTAKVSCR